MQSMGFRVSGLEAYMEDFTKSSATMRMEINRHNEQLNDQKRELDHNAFKFRETDKLIAEKG